MEPRAAGTFRHAAPARFQPKHPLPLAITASGLKPTAARLYYRRVNQAERFQTTEMQASGATWHASIPADCTDSPYPLQYYFEFHEGPAKACLYPGFAPDLLNQPYFVVRAV